MSKLGLVVVIALIAGRINAQNYPAPASEPPTYFVLIQADNGQAFYIRLDSQLYPSSPAGHLILAQLKDSAYPITVGFPGQIYPEQRYLLNIGHKDRAFRLSRRDNNWRLLDDQGQTMPAVADPAAAEMPLLAGARKDDAFSQMMAAIVRDTAVMYNTYAESSDSNSAASLDSARSPTTVDTPAMSVRVRDSSVTSAPTFAIPSASTFTIPSPPVASSAIPSAPTGVVKLSEHKSTQSLSLVYTDHPVDKKTDTIDVIIPIDTQAVAVRTPILSSDTVRATKLVLFPDTSRFTATLHTQVPDSIHSTVTTRSGSPIPGHAPKPDTSARAASTLHKSSLPFVNSDCHAFAADYDVDKLRVRMLSANKDEDRILVAYKIFKTKCFSTNQVSALSEVFTTDAAKFKFLETAYPFVSDDRFPELVGLLSDPVYAGKFRTLTGRH